MKAFRTNFISVVNIVNHFYIYRVRKKRCIANPFRVVSEIYNPFIFFSYHLITFKNVDTLNALHVTLSACDLFTQLIWYMTRLITLRQVVSFLFSKKASEWLHNIDIMLFHKICLCGSTLSMPFKRSWCRHIIVIST